jgi:hypothetical protein
MNDNKTLIVGLLDRSGSMENIKDETVSGWNGFVEDQSKDEGECLVSLALFDGPGYEDWFQWVYENKNAQDVTPLTAQIYRPRGSTPLWASMIKVIDKVGKDLSDMKEEDRPDKVVVITITDGYENNSQNVDKSEFSFNFEEEKKKMKKLHSMSVF